MANSILARMAVIIDGQTAQFNKAMAQSQSQLASLTGSVKSLGAALGVAFTATAIISGLKQVIGLAADFEHTMSTLKAITGATGREFDKLRNDALRLGAATKFTANEVGQLQVAFGRLGFNTKEILDATEATLALAAATGEDLAKSADVAGSTVRGFGLEAKETQRIVDVMAKSFNTTALGLDNFSESMKYVAPVAKAANVSVEETTALLGVLADAGIRGSSAGTALRKIFGDLSKDGRPVQERLAELGKKGITLSDAFDEVGRTAQTALLVLTENTEKSNQLAESFKNVTGEAEAMARVMQDDLIGDADKLSSAFEGLFLKLTKTGALRDLTQALTGIVSALAGVEGDVVQGLDQLARGVQGGVEETNAGFQIIIDKLKDIRRESGKPIDTRIAQELADKYKLTEEQANVLYRAILNINKSLSFQEQVLATFGDFAKGYKDLATAADLYKEGLYKLILAEQINQAQLEKTAAASAESAQALQPQIIASKNLIAGYQRRIQIINDYVSTQTTSEKKVQEAVQATTLNLEFYRETLNKVGKAFDQVALSQGQFGVLTEEAASNLRILAAEAAGLDAFIKKADAIKQSFRDLDVVLKPPDTSQIMVYFDEATGALKRFKNEFGTLTHSSTIMDEVASRFEAGLKKMAAAATTVGTQIKQTTLDFTGVVSGAISSIARSFGEAIGGGENFGKALLGTLGGILIQLGEMLIVAGLGVEKFKVALKTLNGYVAIAAGAALIALGSIVSASIKKMGSSGGSAGASINTSATRNTSSINTSATDAQDVKVTGTIVARGQDLWVVLNNYQDNNRFTRAANG